MSFPFVMDYPWPCVFEGGLIVCVPSTITLEIEPEFRGSRDWAIASIALEGHRMQGQAVDTGKVRDHDIPRRDPMWKAIRDYALRTHSDQISQQFSIWLSELPERIADQRRA